jgi:hypothetical protein
VHVIGPVAVDASVPGAGEDGVEMAGFATEHGVLADERKIA